MAELKPAAWRWRYIYKNRAGPWKVRQTPMVSHLARPGFAALEVEPLYTRPPASGVAEEGWIGPKDVRWIVNSIGELGVMVRGRAFFLYKGESLEYVEPSDKDDDGPLFYRPVFKREFGECAHPINHSDPDLVGTVSLDDSDDWRPLPAPPALATGDRG